MEKALKVKIETSLAVEELFGSFPENKTENQITDTRAGEIALILTQELISRGFWGNPPTEIKTLYLCNCENRNQISDLEAGAFIKRFK